MDVEVEVLDEHGEPLVIPPWPGGMKAWVNELPKVVDPEHPHRLLYSNQLLATIGFSLSMNDTIAHLRSALEKGLPYFDDKLAVGLVIKEFRFLGELVSETAVLGDLDVKVVSTVESRSSLVGHRDCLQVVTQVVVRVFLPDKSKLLAVTLDNFDPATLTCGDILKRLQSFRDVMPTMRLIREYPTVRPFICDQSTHVYGFPGKRDRGLWVQRPHKGPLQPCKLTSPPPLCLRLVRPEDTAQLEKESEWWSLIGAQAGWVGHQETFCGAKEPVTLMLHPPQVPTWVNVSFPDTAKPIKCHTLWKKKIHAAGGSGLRVAVQPHEGLYPNQITLHPDATMTPCEDGMYLPTPKEMAFEGETYGACEPGTSFGTGSLKSGVRGKALQTTYKLEVRADGDVHVLASAPDSQVHTERSDQVPEHVYEGTLATGLTQCQYFRGVHYYRWPGERDVPDSRKLPFCLFQLTQNNRIPDVMTSPLGKRYAGLKDRSFSILPPQGGSAVVGYQDAFVPAHDFFTSYLDEEPRLVLAQLAFLDEGLHVNVSAFILWNMVSLDELRMPLNEANRIKATASVIIRARSQEDVQEHLRECGKLYGVGPDPATIAPKKFAFVPGTLQAPPSSSEALNRSKSVSVSSSQPQGAHTQQQQQQQQQQQRSMTMGGKRAFKLQSTPSPATPAARSVTPTQQQQQQQQHDGSNESSSAVHGSGSGSGAASKSMSQRSSRSSLVLTLSDSHDDATTTDAEHQHQQPRQHQQQRRSSRRASSRQQQEQPPLQEGDEDTTEAARIEQRTRSTSKKKQKDKQKDKKKDKQKDKKKDKKKEREVSEEQQGGEKGGRRRRTGSKSMKRSTDSDDGKKECVIS